MRPCGPSLFRGEAPIHYWLWIFRTPDKFLGGDIRNKAFQLLEFTSKLGVESPRNAGTKIVVAPRPQTNFQILHGIASPFHLA